jgi:hypothetical protein
MQNVRLFTVKELRRRVSAQSDVSRLVTVLLGQYAILSVPHQPKARSVRPKQSALVAARDSSGGSVRPKSTRAFVATN